MDVATYLPVSHHRERVFFTAMAVAMAGVVFVGFAPTFFLRPWFPETAASAPPEPVFYVHGMVFAAFLVVFIAQTSLIARGNVRLHRRLGLAAVPLAVAMLVLGVQVSLQAARRPGGFIDVPVPPLQFLAIPLFDMLLFGTLIAAGFVWRRTAQAHKRLMLLATCNLLEAAIVRIPMPFLYEFADSPLMSSWLADTFIVALVFWDLASRRSLHPVTLWAGALTVASQPFRYWLSGTDAWLAFASWAVSALP